MGGAYDFFDCRFVVNRGRSKRSIIYIYDISPSAVMYQDGGVALYIDVVK